MSKILLMAQQATSAELRRHEYLQAFEHASERWSIIHVCHLLFSIFKENFYIIR